MVDNQGWIAQSYLTHILEEKEWIYPFSKGICAKVKARNSSRIRTHLAVFVFQAAKHYPSPVFNNRVKFYAVELLLARMCTQASVWTLSGCAFVYDQCFVRKRNKTVLRYDTARFFSNALSLQLSPMHFHSCRIRQLSLNIKWQQVFWMTFFSTFRK